MSRWKAVIQKLGTRALLFLVYLFIGAGIFMGIEKKYKEEKINKLALRYNSSKHKLMRDYGINQTDMKVFENLIKELVSDGLFGASPQWDFANGFFFCVNVVTTIGYGHIVPMSVGGKLACILYAIIGIPLTGYFLRTVGNELTTLFAFSIKYFERRLYNREAERIEMKCAITAFMLAIIWLVIGGAIFSASELKWDFVDAFYFSFITMTTIGFGDLVPGLQNNDQHVSINLAVEVAFLIFYVIGLSLMSGVIFSLSNFIEEKTKKFDMQDPMDAIRNLRIENLNTKAMKKLGYKMTNGPLDEMTHYNLNTRRGTIVPDDTAPRRISKFFDEAQKERTANKNLVPPILPNGTLTRRAKTADSEENVMANGQAIAEEKCDKSFKEDQTTEVDNVTKKPNYSRVESNNSVVVDVDISPAQSRRHSNGRPFSANSVSGIRRLKGKNNIIEPSLELGTSRNDNKKVFSTWSEPQNGYRLTRTITQPECKPSEFRRSNEIGLPSEMFAGSINKRIRPRKVLERTASESHTDEIEYNEIMEEILKEHLNTKKPKVNIKKNNGMRSPTPEFLSLTRQFSEDCESQVETNRHADDSVA
ncbi:TWiK family of potassium channels protein 18-like [Rhopilema esculentum]|uniref:TWiK family of potassium channels protein 18-like n=1 Tax=Rhopilema esculentum TaxID=499914 RepID=UPI0031D93066